MDNVVENPYIGPSHISLYFAVLHFYRVQQFENPLLIFARDLKRQAKINSSSTFYRCLRDLRSMGYLRYVASHNPFLGSLVYLE